MGARSSLVVDIFTGEHGEGYIVVITAAILDSGNFSTTLFALTSFIHVRPAPYRDDERGCSSLYCDRWYYLPGPRSRTCCE